MLRFESSVLPSGELTSFDEYIGRMEPSQQSIYYIVAPSRGLADASPYMEAFRSRKVIPKLPPPLLFTVCAALRRLRAASLGLRPSPLTGTHSHTHTHPPHVLLLLQGKAETEVLYLYAGTVDDFVMTNLAKYNNRKLTTAEAGSVDVAKDGSSSSKGAGLLVSACIGFVSACSVEMHSSKLEH